MKYIYGEGVSKPKSSTWLFVPLAALVIGIYVYANLQAPTLLATLRPADATAKALASSQPDSSSDRLYIPKINVDIPTATSSGDEIDALAHGVVQRSPASGDPKDGGNYVLVGHHFSFALTPSLTNERSPFYHLDKLAQGDDIYVDYSGTRYAYKVDAHSFVAPTETTTESHTDQSQLTLYSLENNSQGQREVVTAKLVGQVIWNNGKPLLKSDN